MAAPQPAGGCIRDSKRVCPTFDPKLYFSIVVPHAYEKVLPRLAMAALGAWASSVNS